MLEKPQMTGWWPDLFDPFRQAGERLAEWFAPRTDATSNENAYEINVELPGVKEEDIDVQVHEGVMTVSGEKKSERKEEQGGYFFSERQYGRFQRTFRLPADASEDEIKATFNDGVLKITVPRSEPEKVSAKKISVSRE